LPWRVSKSRSSAGLAIPPPGERENRDRSASGCGGRNKLSPIVRFATAGRAAAGRPAGAIVGENLLEI
jgi:hypothetical protein